MKTRNRRRMGFTLVELLVVISIIGMLIALLLPAVQAARESGRQTTCANNLKNLALGVVSYEAGRNLYPGYVNDLDRSTGVGSVAPGVDIENDTRSWTFTILKQLDNVALYDKYADPAPVAGFPNPNATANITESLDLFVCPSNPPEGLGTSSTNYVANSGQIDLGTSATGTGGTAPYEMSPGNGVFHRRDAIAGNGARIMSQAYISGADGVTTTIMLSENADAFQWFSTLERYAGFTYNGDPNPTNPRPLEPPTTTPTAGPLGLNVFFAQSKANGLPPNASPGWARPSAYHPGIIQFAFCDGRVRKISETINYGVYQALMTPRGQAAGRNSTNTAYYSFAAPPALGSEPWPTRVVNEEAIQ